MSKRPPNELESRLHQAALTAPKNEITAKQAEAVVPDAAARQNALNFLLGVGLFKSLKDSKGTISFRAVSKGELVATKDLNGEENLVLNHIKQSGNEGIWTKHLKAKTNLHQTILDRCLKTLGQKRLIKRVPSVQHPTRKIYMLESLEPSIALTGGPWYTDNELDTEFIQHLMEACLKFIKDLSFPKRREGAEGALYPISNSPKYPTAQHIRNSLKKARLTETDLTVEHVEMLLNVLILDGKIEKIPAFGSALWESMGGDESDEDSDEKRSEKKRKRRNDSDDEKSTNRKRKKGKAKDIVSSDDDDDDDDDNEEESSSRKKSKSKRKRVLQSDTELDSEPQPRKKKKKKKRKKKAESDDSADSSDSEDDKKRKKKKKRKSHSSSQSGSSSESDDHRSRPGKMDKRKTTKRSPSPFNGGNFDMFDTGSGGSVYRAVKEERVSMGWSESPCSSCPSFDFCKAGGPVNPQECVYYVDWLAAGTVAKMDDEV